MKSWVIGNTGVGRAIADALVERDRDDVFISSEAQVNVTDHIAMVNFVERHGPFNQIIFAAGVNFPSMINRLELDCVKYTFEVNVLGFINLINVLTRYNPPATVCAIVSEAANKSMCGSIAYCSSKAALKMAIRCAGRELAPDWKIFGVSSSIVEGTYITKNTDKICADMRNIPVEVLRRKSTEDAPMGRRITVSEVADIVVELLDTTTWLTGTTVNITGNGG